MKKRVVIAGILELIISVLAAFVFLFLLTELRRSGLIVYAPDIVHIIIVTAIFYLVTCILIEYMYQVCILGSYDGESIAKRKLKTFIVCAILAVMAFTYYVLALEAKIVAPGVEDSDIVVLAISLIMGVISLLSFFIDYQIILKGVKIPIISRMPDTKISGGRIFDSIGKRIYSEKKQITPEQVVSKYLRNIVNTLSILLILWMIIGKSINYKGSVIGYMTSGSWEKGLNVFAFTACIFVFCGIYDIFNT